MRSQNDHDPLGCGSWHTCVVSTLSGFYPVRKPYTRRAQNG